MSHQETQRTFTPEQIQEMYAFIDTYILTKTAIHYATQWFHIYPEYKMPFHIPAQAVMDLRADLYTLQAVASAPPGVPAQGRYVVRHGYRYPKINEWWVVDTFLGKLGKCYYSEQEAEIAAAALNAGALNAGGAS